MLSPTMAPCLFEWVNKKLAGAGPVPVRNQFGRIDKSNVLCAIRGADGHRARPCKALWHG